MNKNFQIEKLWNFFFFNFKLICSIIKNHNLRLQQMVQTIEDLYQQNVEPLKHTIEMELQVQDAIHHKQKLAPG